MIRDSEVLKKTKEAPFFVIFILPALAIGVYSHVMLLMKRHVGWKWAMMKRHVTMVMCTVTIHSDVCDCNDREAQGHICAEINSCHGAGPYIVLLPHPPTRPGPDQICYNHHSTLLSAFHY